MVDVFVALFENLVDGFFDGLSNWNIFSLVDIVRVFVCIARVLVVVIMINIFFVNIFFLLLVIILSVNQIFIFADLFGLIILLLGGVCSEVIVEFLIEEKEELLVKKTTSGEDRDVESGE